MHLRDPESKLPYYMVKTYEEILEDTSRGKVLLEKEHVGEIKYLAYPFGQYNETSIQAILDAGIELAFTTEPGYVQIGDDPYMLKRQGVAPHHSLDDFIRKVNGEY